MKELDINYIEDIREDLEKHMHQHCKRYLANLEKDEENYIGRVNTTPRYYNFKKFDRDTKVLTIASTQVWELPNDLSFEIQTDYDFNWLKFGFVRNFWQQFKEFRTEFLEKHYPTIKTI